MLVDDVVVIRLLVKSKHDCLAYEVERVRRAAEAALRSFKLV
jgi:hypothetical protein